MTEIVKTTWEAGLDMITDLVNQIIVEGVIPAEWELVEKMRYFRKRNYIGMKLTYITKIAEYELEIPFYEKWLHPHRLHQGLVLILLLFTIVLEAVSREIRSRSRRTALYWRLCTSEMPEDLKGRLEASKRALESKGLRVNA